VEYIQSEFTSDQRKADRLLEQLEYNPLVESVCSVPLNCAIVCHLWRTLEEALPTTMTELYKKIILNVILRNMRKKDEFKHISSLTNFNVLPKELQLSWELLCKFAYEAIVRDQIVFSEEELVDIFPHGLEDVLCFGLLQTANTILEVGYGISFHFLHLTFQEYLAALYIVKQISELGSSPEHFVSIVGSSHHTVLCRFIFGIYFNGIKLIRFTDVQPFIPKFGPTLCHCTFEAKNENFCTKLLDSIVVKNSYIIFYAHSAYDCAAMLYVINYIHIPRDTGNVNILFGNSGVREAQIRELADILARKDGMLQIQGLDLSCNELTDKSVVDLFQRASISSSFRSLHWLDFKGNKIGSHSITLLGKSNFNQLCALTLSDCPLGVSGMQALEDAVSSGSLHRLNRLLLAGSLTSDADINGALLATSLNVIMCYNFDLTYLDLSRNNLGIPGASALSRILSDQYKITNSSALQRAINIDLDKTNLGDNGLIHFAECSGHKSVHRLSLNSNDIHATGVSYLADGIVSGRIVLQELSLDDNPQLELKELKKLVESSLVSTANFGRLLYAGVI
jgi:hypothetical protein